jgi:hypothetical protein
VGRVATSTRACAARTSHTLSMSMGDVVTQAALRKLADEYIAQAEEIESKENNAAIDDGTSA